jgi:hypothetical protein
VARQSRDRGSGRDRQSPLPAGECAEDANLDRGRRRLPDVRALPAGEQLARAFEAAFGSRGEAVLAVPTAAADEDVRYTPGRLVWLPFGPVLVSEGKVVRIRPMSAPAGSRSII